MCFSRLIHGKKRPIMLVYYDKVDNTVECFDWYSQKISLLSGPFTLELWNEASKYCCVDSDESLCTRIYIWAGMLDKHLAYNEPIDSYIKNPSLLNYGQGFHYGSGKQFDK